MSQTTNNFSNDNITRFKQIMNAKVRIDESMAGHTILLRVTSAKYGYFDEKLGANKDLYNTNAVKMSIVNSDWFKAGLAEAVALETAGDSDSARIKFDEIMNAAGLGFSVINRDGSKQQFVVDERVNCPIELRDTEDETTKEVRTSIVIDRPYAAKSKIITKSNTDLFSDLVPMTEPTKAIKA